MWPPRVQHKAPSTGIVKYWLARTWLQLLGWNVTGELPPDKKFVLIGAPHTSNWDFVIAIPALYVLRIKAYWMGKHSLFRWPLGYFMRRLGGIPIDRRSAHGVVAQTVQQFQQNERLVILIPAKGTRGKTRYWKSGFYHIARLAGVSVVCGYLDFDSKTAHIGYSFRPSGNIREDMDRVREFFAPARGRHVELEDSIRLKEEDDLMAADSERQ